MFPALAISSLGPSLVSFNFTLKPIKNVISYLIFLFQIESDFSYLYSEKNMALLVKFEIFVQKLKKYVDLNNINFGPRGSEYITELNNPKKPGKYNNIT